MSFGREYDIRDPAARRRIVNAAWSGQSDIDETAKQRDDLETYGRLLPEEIHVYVANFWGGHPPGYQDGLRKGTWRSSASI